MLRVCTLSFSLIIAWATSAIGQEPSAAPPQMDASPASMATTTVGSSTIQTSFTGAEPVTLARDLQGELKRLGCLSGDVDGVWGDESKKALKNFARHAKLFIANDEPTIAVLDAASAMKARACPVVCGDDQRVVNGRCVAKVRERTVRKEPAREPREERRRYRAERPSEEPKSSGGSGGGLKLCNVGGRQMAVCD
jgi:hypothetical protein